MFSFRTTPIEDQLDRALMDGPVSVLCSDSCWNAMTGKYLYDIFSERGVLHKVYLPEEGHICFDIDELKGSAAVVVEIQDIGCRYFPLAVDVLRLVSELKTLGNEAPSLYIVDHPNPAGRDVEGTFPAGESDVWTPDVVQRHGLTLGELIHLYHYEIGASYPLHIISADVANTARSLMPWTIPASEDSAGLFTPFFYTGGRLWTDTNITPGLGTCRPYEMIGAPFIKANGALPTPAGVKMRPCHFIPSSGMYEGETCYGWQTILMPGAHYNSLLHTVILMRYFLDHYSQFRISESLYSRIADPVITEYLKGTIGFDIVDEHVKSEEQKWIRKAKRFLLYNDQPCRIK